MNIFESMKYKVLNSDQDQPLFERLAMVRKIDDNLEDFLNPSYKTYRNSPSQLSQIDKAVERICEAIDKKEKIMIFGDYDVDGIMSSFVLYTFFRKYAGYHNISIQLPHRKKDGYGIKSYHLDAIKDIGCSLVITVDNGITAIEEAKHAKDIGLDMIVTDHHHALDNIPEAYACINPQISSEASFKEVCGATVARKLALHLADALEIAPQTKVTYMKEMLPFVGIATVADCMPLVSENRLIVKKSLEQMNTMRSSLNKSLQGFLTYLQIQEVDTYHIGFMIAPRLNATGRVGSAHHGLACLLCSDTQKQKGLLEHMDSLNDQRKETQEEMIQKADEITDPSKMIITAADTSFHAGIVGIVAGRLTEKYYKPSAILEIDTEKGIATGSLRGPDYFNVVEMLKDAEELLVRYGGHEQAGGLTVDLKNVEALFTKFDQYCKKTIGASVPEKTLEVDTVLSEAEAVPSLIDDLKHFGPYGIGNPKPTFLLQKAKITLVDIIGKKERKHLKVHIILGETSFHGMRRGKGDEHGSIPLNTEVDIIGSIKKDDWNGGWYMDIVDLGQ